MCIGFLQGPALSHFDTENFKIKHVTYAHRIMKRFGDQMIILKCDMGDKSSDLTVANVGHIMHVQCSFCVEMLTEQALWGKVLTPSIYITSISHALVAFSLSIFICSIAVMALDTP